MSSFVSRQPVAARRWQRRASPLSRYALLAYAAIVVDASLYPFTGWRDLGIGPFDYLAADWPRHALAFDLAVNACGYWPLGFLAGLALHPKVRGIGSVLIATALALVLSICLEAIQTYLPTRVASSVDVASNVGGALFGAVCAARLAHVLLDTGRLRMWRSRWFASDASRGLVLVLVWFGALIYPDTFVFGIGGLLKVLAPDWSAQLAVWAGLASDADVVASAERFQFAEAMVAALMLFGAGLLLLGLLRATVTRPRRIALVALFAASTVAVKSLAYAFLFDDAALWPPLTPGARTGVAFGAGALVIAALLPWKVRWAMCCTALVVALAVINVYPDNPYVLSVGLSWTRGRLMNFYGLASGVNLIWPFVAIVYALRHRAMPNGDARARPAAADRGATRRR